MASRPSFAALTSDLIQRDRRTVIGVPTVIIGPDGRFMPALAYLDAHDAARIEPRMDRMIPC